MSNFNLLQYPLIAPAYKARVINKLCTGEKWDNFRTARLLISVGQPYHEGDKFKATVEWCRKNFDQVQVLVGDTLQRYASMLETDLDAGTAFDNSRKEGDLWLERNFSVLNSLPGLEIKRWENWRLDESYKPRLLKIMASYDENSAFRKAIDEAVVAYCSRKNRLQTLQDTTKRKKILDLSYQYVFEEIAIYTLIAERERAVDIYPGSCLAVMSYFYGDVPEGLPAGLGMRSMCSLKLVRSNKSSVSLADESFAQVS